jgi:D-alanine-D-alanine ligase
MTDYTPDLQGRAILMVSDFVGEGYDKKDLEEEKIFLTEVKSDLKKLGIEFYLVEIKSIEELKQALSKFDKDKIVIFNWAEELYKKPNSGYLITQFFDENGYKYSGASTENLILANNRMEFNKTLEKNGIRVPVQYELSAKNIRFPVIVKAKYEHGSYGISLKSILTDQKSLEEFIKDVNPKKFLGEQFINGDEYTISVWGNKSPEVLPIFMIKFESNKDEKYRIIDYASKWDRRNKGYEGIYSDKAKNVAKSLEEKLRDTAFTAYKATKCRGFTRFEMRVEKGTPYIIDFNPNPNFRPDSAFLKSTTTAGYNYGQAVARLCEFALNG